MDLIESSLGQARDLYLERIRADSARHGPEAAFTKFGLWIQVAIVEVYRWTRAQIINLFNRIGRPFEGKSRSRDVIRVPLSDKD